MKLGDFMSVYEELCRHCAHWNSRKEKCAVMGVKFGEKEGTCSVYIPDPMRGGEKP